MKLATIRKQIRRSLMHIDTHNLLTLRYFSAHKLVIMELNKVELGIGISMEDVYRDVEIA